MALPKSRQSKARTRKRRATWKLAAPNLVECPNCGNPKITHVACRECGYYNGRQVIQVKAKKPKS